MINYDLHRGVNVSTEPGLLLIFFFYLSRIINFKINMRYENSTPHISLYMKSSIVKALGVFMYINNVYTLYRVYIK